MEGTITGMEQACLDPMAAGTKLRKQKLRDRLLAIHPVPASFDLTMHNAGALLTCGSPEGTALVLNRFIPARGDERRRWLLLRWQAAAAALDHQQAALALRRHSDGAVVDSPTAAWPPGPRGERSDGGGLLSGLSCNRV